MSNLIKFIEDVNTKGGASLNLVTGNYNPTTGYMVAIANKEQTYHTLDKVSLKTYILANEQVLIDSNLYLGGWLSDNDGNKKVYLDLSEHFSDKAKAIQAGKDRNQIAIWDCANQKEIFTNK